MNPWGVILILAGLAMVIIGFHGSQHNALQAIKGQL